MKNILLCVLGAVVSLTVMWGGAYLLSIYASSDWQHFPICMTAGYAFIGGVGMFCSGLVGVVS